MVKIRPSFNYRSVNMRRQSRVTDDLGREYFCAKCKEIDNGRTNRYYYCRKILLKNGHIINNSENKHVQNALLAKCQGSMRRIYSADGIFISQLEGRLHTLCHDVRVAATAATTPTDILEMGMGTASTAMVTAATPLVLTKTVLEVDVSKNLVVTTVDSSLTEEAAKATPVKHALRETTTAMRGVEKSILTFTSDVEMIEIDSSSDRQKHSATITTNHTCDMSHSKTPVENHADPPNDHVEGELGPGNDVDNK